MSMMCVTSTRATAAMFSAVQIPPPTAMRPVTHVISILKDPCSKGSSGEESSEAPPAPLFKHADQRSAASVQRFAATAQPFTFILSDHPQAQPAFPYLW